MMDDMWSFAIIDTGYTNIFPPFFNEKNENLYVLRAH
jgi:hypothetical protein